MWTIARLSFGEYIRERLLWSSAAFGMLAVGLALAASQLSFTDEPRIAMDFGLTAISLIGGLISILLGSTMIVKEIQNRTAYLILSKSVHRWEFVLGRYFGLVAVVFLNTLIMTGISLIVYVSCGGRLGLQIPLALLGMCLEFAILAAIACAFSTFATASISAIGTMALWVLGHASADVKLFAAKIEVPALAIPIKAFAYLVPDFSLLDFKADVAHLVPVSASGALLVITYSICFATFMLALASLVFNYRDL